MVMTVKAKILNDINKQITEKEEEIRILKERRNEILALDDCFVDPQMKISDIPEFSKWDKIMIGLNTAGIITVEDLVNLSPKKLLRIRNIGKGRLQEIQEWMAKYNLTFAAEKK